MPIWYARPFYDADGRLTTKYLEACICNDRRGPRGGVCGNCAQAIPDDAPLLRYFNEPLALAEFEAAEAEAHPGG